jgi:hypothetical protein
VRCEDWWPSGKRSVEGKWQAKKQQRSETTRTVPGTSCNKISKEKTSSRTDLPRNLDDEALENGVTLGFKYGCRIIVTSFLKQCFRVAACWPVFRASTTSTNHQLLHFILNFKSSVRRRVEQLIARSPFVVGLK